MTNVKGIHVLIISVNKDSNINVGTLGNLNFKKGLYAYVGSAQTNLEKRVKLHLRKSKRRFWHIDYLLDNSSTRVLKVFHKKAEKPDECKVAKKIDKKTIPIKMFGSSDCKCRSHLFMLKDYQFLSEFMQEIAW